MIALLTLLAVTHANAFDLIVQNGTIVDGSGKDPYVSDIGIKDGRIAAIGLHLTGATNIVDAKGLTVAPGFIDIHTHAENILQYPKAENFVRDGVTSVVIGNCGGSTLNVKDFFQKLEAARPAINVATLVGHNSVRIDAMGGSFNREPTKEELAKMVKTVDNAMKDGALGFSTGLEYVPGAYAKPDEIIALARVAASYGGIYTSHMRSEGVHEKEALEETFLVAQDAGIPAEVSHIKLDAKPYWGQAKDRLKQIEDARQDGLKITQDEYPYTAYSTTIAILMPAWSLEGKTADIQRRLDDPDQRKRIEDDMAKMREQQGEPDYGWVAIASNKNQRLNGLRIPEAAKIMKRSDSLAGQISLIFDLVLEGKTSCVFFAMNEDDVRTFMKNENTMFISDSTVQTMLDPSLPHPRSYGSNARILARYVRDEKVLTLQEAIRRMTSLPAKIFNIKDRGLLEKGDWADIVVFDPAKVKDMATFTNPRVYPAGIDDVIVNGTPVIDDNLDTTARPGKAIRRGQ